MQFKYQNSPISSNSLSHKSIQTIQFSISTQFKCQKHFYLKLFSLVNKGKWFQVLLCIINSSIKHQSFIYSQLNVKTVLFLIIEFSICIHFISTQPIDRTLIGATTPGQSEPRSYAYKWVLRISSNSSIREA